MLHIFAQRDEGGIVDVLLWLVPVAIWVIGSIAATLNKKKEQERRQRVREQINPIPTATAPAPRPSPAPPPPVPPPLPGGATRRPQPVLKRNPKRYAGKPPVKVPPARIPIAAPPPIIEEPPVAPVARRVAAPATPQARPQPAAVSARVIHQWLTPGTLRQQFILTELLQPPVALRERREI